MGFGNLYTLQCGMSKHAYNIGEPFKVIGRLYANSPGAPRIPNATVFIEVWRRTSPTNPLQGIPVYKNTALTSYHYGQYQCEGIGLSESGYYRVYAYYTDENGYMVRGGTTFYVNREYVPPKPPTPEPPQPESPSVPTPDGVQVGFLILLGTGALLLFAHLSK